MHKVLHEVLTGTACVLQDSELAVSLLYELGEGASEEALKAGSGPLGQLALGEHALLVSRYASASVAPASILTINPHRVASSELSFMLV